MARPYAIHDFGQTQYIIDSGQISFQKMQSTLSSLIDSSTYDFEDLCDSIPVRISKYEELADKGALRAQDDWKRYVGPTGVFSGCMSRFNVVALAVPECPPDRLEATTYVAEFAFLYDGKSISQSLSGRLLCLQRKQMCLILLPAK